METLRSTNQGCPRTRVVPRVITTDEQRGPRAKGPKAKKLNPSTKPDRDRLKGRDWEMEQNAIEESGE